MKRRRLLAEVEAGRVIYNNQASVCQCFDGMEGVWRHDGNDTGLGNIRSSIDGDFQLTFDDLINLFLRMEMRMNR